MDDDMGVAVVFDDSYEDGSRGDDDTDCSDVGDDVVVVDIDDALSTDEETVTTNSARVVPRECSDSLIWVFCVFTTKVL
jgi:hypothetical protein